MEGVLTSVLAWFVFKENFGRRIFAGMLLIVAAGVLLSWDQAPVAGFPWGAIAIIGIKTAQHRQRQQSAHAEQLEQLRALSYGARAHRKQC
ncbi:hypothetical protein [Burkholderia sp. LMU1-1-1.1]|uniref:hypothetical protein n=1 Tax=Burkholderia sp. LMU1-1-1.1 TaxID=3135266 RepID=UPI00341B7E34